MHFTLNYSEIPNDAIEDWGLIIYGETYQA